MMSMINVNLLILRNDPTDNEVSTRVNNMLDRSQPIYFTEQNKDFNESCQSHIQK